MTHTPTKPEVMSPAGHWPQLNAAIEAGADAVYFGLNHFTARAKVGFTLTELPDAMRTLHRRGVRGYVTFNTLVFDHELGAAARALEAIAACDVDAIIVQDVGVAQLARRIAPDLEIHGSTQMSITSAEGVELARQFGVSRVVLARELSLDEIRQIRAATSCELELFVHGALCVSYSGQCFSSEAWGGRSANRGQCAQACRLPYELLVDDVLRPLADARYLLSPGDLYALQQIPEIVQIGVSALKIEGRYKSEEYVALTTASYRKAVDEAWAGLPQSLTRAEELRLEQVYSRGMGPFFIGGTNHQLAVSGRAPRHRGVLVGKVSRVLGDRVLIAPEPSSAEMPLKPGDGVVFDAADWRSPEEREEGGRLYQVLPARGGGGLLELGFGHGALDTRRIREGDLLWRTHDPQLTKAVQQYTDPASPQHKQPLAVAVMAREGEQLRTTWSLVAQPHVEVTVISPEPLTRAQHRPADASYLREQLGRLGATSYRLDALEAEIGGEPFAPPALLNAVRREAAERLAAIQAAPRQSTVHDAAASLAAMRAERSRQRVAEDASDTPQLHLLVRTPEQLDAAIGLRPTSITLDYLELYGLRPAVERVRASGIAPRVASPRVLKPSEQRIVHFLRKLECPILVRSGGLLRALLEDATHPQLIGDFSLNAANVLTAETFLGMGLERIAPTHDLNAAQVASLLETLGGDRIELIAYQHLPVFHTEHCVFCRFLSSGTSYKDCGHPCEQHKLALRDSRGRAHPVMADVGCRNTVFGAEAQEASRYLADWMAAGARHVRLEFVHESAAQVTEVGAAFAETLAGRASAADLSAALARSAPERTTDGSLFVPDDYLTIPLMQ